MILEFYNECWKNACDIAHDLDKQIIIMTNEIEIIKEKANSSNCVKLYICAEAHSIQESKVNLE